MFDPYLQKKFQTDVMSVMRGMATEINKAKVALIGLEYNGTSYADFTSKVKDAIGVDNYNRVLDYVVSVGNVITKESVDLAARGKAIINSFKTVIPSNDNTSFTLHQYDSVLADSSPVGVFFQAIGVM